MNMYEIHSTTPSKLNGRGDKGLSAGIKKLSNFLDTGEILGVQAISVSFNHFNVRQFIIP